MQRGHRLLALVVVLLLVAGLCVHYGATHEERSPHPTGEQLAENPAGWDGERVLLFGTVTEQTEGGFVMDVETDSGEIARTVEVYNAQPSVDTGGVVQVYGELSERGTLQQADSVVVVTESPREHWYKLGLSGVGGLLAAGAFLWYWRIDPHRVRFVARGGEDDG
ncbi:hypothetical protein SAMN05216226_107183 [Halovenus aranensis]|uniref:Uncharacterized protein n=1 Tax=Halovenus aranensis TaxID=890420 RepID=A0A1G8VV48_9EURY|nr:hypothetical protein [Halovenus aranensis]SDJ69882.1 hypothetical protein SAMN05216226_107183 [Halovenus aranensis]